MICRFQIDKISQTRKNIWYVDFKSTKSPKRVKIYGMSISNRQNLHYHIRFVDLKSTKSPLPNKVCRFEIDKISITK